MVIYVLFLGLFLQSFSSCAADSSQSLVEIPDPMMKQLKIASDSMFQPKVQERLNWLRNVTSDSDYAESLKRLDFDSTVKIAVNSQTFQDFSCRIQSGDTALLAHSMLEMYLLDANNEKIKNGFCAAAQGLIDGHIPGHLESAHDFAHRARAQSQHAASFARLITSPSPERSASLPVSAHDRIASPVGFVARRSFCGSLPAYNPAGVVFGSLSRSPIAEELEDVYLHPENLSGTSGAASTARSGQLK